MKFDTPTLFTGVMIADFAGAAVLLLFFVLWKARTRCCARSLLLWAAGMFIAGTGTFLVGARGTIPDSFSILAANALLILGLGLRRSGLAAFFGKPPRTWIAAAMAATWLALYQYPAFQQSFLARVNFVQGCLILCCLSMIWMAASDNREKLASARLLLLATLIEMAGYIWFAGHQNALLFEDFPTVFQQGFMTVFLMVELFARVLAIVLQVCLVVERSLLGFKEKANKDPLTGLPNRRAFRDGAETWITGQARPGKSFSLIMFDLDHFKSINDNFGHAMGDAVLQLFGRILRDSLGPDAIPGRIGGEEFVVFLPGEGRELALLTTQRICRKFSVECQEASGGKLQVSASVGLVTAGPGTGLDRAMEAADRGLYRAKRQGRSQVVTMDLAADGLLKRTTAATAFSALRRRIA